MTQENEYTSTIPAQVPGSCDWVSVQIFIGFLGPLINREVIHSPHIVFYFLYSILGSVCIHIHFRWILCQ